MRLSRISDYTANQWRSLAGVFILVGLTLALTISLIGVVLIVIGVLMLVQIQFRIGAKPKPEAARKD